MRRALVLTTGWIVEARGLEKWYGAIPAVRGIDVQLAPGEFLTIFGPNGAGKSTLIGLLSGVVRASRGEISIRGRRVEPGDEEWRRHLGVLSHQTYLYAGLTASENLDFFGRLYGLGSLRERIERGLVEVGLWERRDEKVRGFSRGMQQRLALARTLLHDPDLVLLDEPYTGLDPHAARMLRGVLERLKDGRRTVLMVTHNLSQGLELADRVSIQVAGRWISEEARSAIDPLHFEQVYSERVAGALG